MFSIWHSGPGVELARLVTCLRPPSILSIAHVWRAASLSGFVSQANNFFNGAALCRYCSPLADAAAVGSILESRATGASAVIAEFPGRIDEVLPGLQGFQVPEPRARIQAEKLRLGFGPWGCLDSALCSKVFGRRLIYEKKLSA